MEPMTLDDAKKWADGYRPLDPTAGADEEACVVLADALTAAEAKVAALEAEVAKAREAGFRDGIEQAVRACDVESAACLTDAGRSACANLAGQIRALAPALAPVEKPARPFDAEAFAKALRPIAGESAYDLCVRIRAAALAAGRGKP